MKRLIQWSIDHHSMVLVLSVLLAAAGVWTARRMPVDVFPDLTAPTVTILTEGHGMAPDEMETLVTFPIEAAINGASDVRRVRSATAVGIAVVWVEFDWGTDIFLARQIVAEKLALVSGIHLLGQCHRRARIAIDLFESDAFQHSQPALPLSQFVRPHHR